MTDAIPENRAAGMLEFWKILGLFYGSLALVGVGVVFVAGLDPASTLLLVGSMAGALAFMIPSLLWSVFKARRVLPTIRVREGIVEVYRPYHLKGTQPLASFPLSETRWHLGRLREDSNCRGRGGAIVPNNPAVVLRRPRAWKGVEPASEFNATGSSPEMLRIWRGFLQIAGVPEGK